ncbi:hypothetical protein LUZ61_002861 [Rhynchospora tenuis]|uniref:Uncharacterized protein n=1 Tax=Rhynchospora tenuis TaxID=198213 RepID=A0AAD5ZJW4_9POAL|nr:hypothetical protein LUZ61_002861 [Rhynchospora tenuis]
MSIALERGFLRPCQFETPAAASCSSSSVGRNSDSDGGNGDGSDGGDEAEVQSSFKGPLDTMDALEDSLPFRRGISKFYCGKSKSFTTLADAMSRSTSAKDLAKPESAYTRKRKNLLSFNIISKKSHNNCDSFSKKPSSNSSRRKLTDLDTSSSGSNSSSSEEDPGQKGLLPPLHPHSRPAAVMIGDDSNEAMSVPMRSFSMADLQGMVGSSPLIGKRDGQKRRFY